MKKGYARIMAIALLCSGACSYRYVPVPPNVFQFQDELVALKTSGKAWDRKKTVKIPAEEVGRKLGDYKDLQLIHYFGDGLREVPFRVTDGHIVADLYTGQRYLLRDRPLSELRNNYEVLCRIDLTAGRYLDRAVLGRVCTQILCAPDRAQGRSIYKRFPELGPFQGDLGLDGIEVGGWGASSPGICGECLDLQGGGALIPGETCIESPPVPDPEIAFVSHRDGNREIYVMNSNGTSQTNITNHPAEDYMPLWSPDGREILFKSNRGEHVNGRNLYVTRQDGTGTTQITHEDMAVDQAAWSHDGQSVLYSRRVSMDRVIFSLHQVRRSSASPTGWSPPVELGVTNSIIWGDISVSPNDQKIAYSTYNNLFIFDVATGAEVMVDDQAAHAYYPDHSSSGKIVFTREANFLRNLAAVSSDGSGLFALTSGCKTCVRPIWSPDAEYIAYHKWDDGQGDLFVMKADGTEARNLTNDPANDWGTSFSSSGTPPASWSPQGDRIAFTTDRFGNWEIATVTLSGSGNPLVRRLTDHVADDYGPQWRPEGP